MPPRLIRGGQTETTVNVAKDDRPADAKINLWNYTKEGDDRPVVLFEYQKTKEHSHSKDFLKDFPGWLYCNGYEAIIISAQASWYAAAGSMPKDITPMW